MKRLLLTLLLPPLIAAAIYFDAYEQLHRALALPQPITFEIEDGSHAATVLQQVDQQHLLPNRRCGWYLRLYIRARALGPKIRSGEYELEPGMSAIDALSLFLSGKTLVHELRIIEGSTFAQALAQIAADPLLRHTLDAQASAQDVMAALDAPDQAPEGSLFPDTYQYTKHTPDLSILRRAYAQMQNVLAEQWPQRAPDLPYRSVQEALTMASIVEKETGAANERAQIAGVFVRRLRLGMRLQTDPTVIYGLGAGFDGNLRLADLRRDTPYNTYTRGGLPPTPICLPGRAAIRAALHPDDGKTLFFVSRGDGTHQFSETLEQHNAAVRHFQLNKP